MATITVHPSGYSSADSSYSSISSSYPVNNGYTDTSSNSYAYITCRTGSRAKTYISYTFDFSDIPANAVITSVTAKAKGRISSTNYLTSAYYEIFKNGTEMTGQTSFRTTTATVYDIGDCGEWTREELDDLMIRATAVRGTSNTSRAAYIYFYGAEIEVVYSTAPARTVTSTISGDGTIEPSGATSTFEGAEYELIITPTNKSDPVTVTNNGTDVTSQLVAYGPETSTSAVPADVTTSGIQSGSSYAEYAVGRSAEDPASSSNNMYASSSSVGHADYSFDLSAVPSDAEITGITAVCYGHRESSTISSTYVSRCTLICGSAISEEVDFPSTSDSTITVVANEMPSRADLTNLVVRHEVGYYGGLVLGITLTVEYAASGGTVDHYVYTYTVGQDATIAVTIGATSKLYVKVNGSWVEISKAYKKVNGSWVEQSDLTTVFDSSTNYAKG